MLYALLIVTAVVNAIGLHAAVGLPYALGEPGKLGGPLLQLAEAASRTNSDHRANLVKPPPPSVTTSSTSRLATSANANGLIVTTASSPAGKLTNQQTGLFESSPDLEVERSKPKSEVTSTRADEQPTIPNTPLSSSPKPGNEASLPAIPDFPTQEKPKMWPGEEPMSGQGVPHWGTTATPPTQGGLTQRAKPARATLYSGRGKLFTRPASELPRPISISGLPPLQELSGQSRPLGRPTQSFWPSAQSSRRRWMSHNFSVRGTGG